MLAFIGCFSEHQILQKEICNVSVEMARVGEE